MIDHITGLEPDIPDPAQLDLLSCFFDHQPESEQINPYVSQGMVETAEGHNRDPTPETDNPFSLTKTQLELAGALWRKSRALASKPKQQEDVQPGS